METVRSINITSRQCGTYLLTKRILDLLLMTLLTPILVPLFLVIAVAIKLDSRGSVFYKAPRVGFKGNIFTVYKFRSMVFDADPSLHRLYLQQLMRSGAGVCQTASGPGHMFKVQNDPRITRVGRILRRTSLDELPQIINVLKGEMTLVGPRPEVAYALEEYESWQWDRFSVLPGVTGLWQVSGRSKLSPVEMLKLDIKYANECSFWLDCKILLKTIPTVLRMDGAG